ncbi:MAG: alanine racemase [Luteolibacter sp.]
MNPTRPESSHPRAWAEVDLAALRHNLTVAHRHFGGDLIAVVKADAYGHGLPRVAKVLDGHVRFLGVATVDEAQALRDVGVRNDVFLLGPSLADERMEFVRLGVTPSLSSLEEAEDFARIGRDRGKAVKAHLMVDTGMGREGVLPEELPRAWPLMRALEGLEIDGLATHLPSADEDAGFTSDQLERFREITAKLGGKVRFRWIHASNSAGLLAHPNAGCTLARPGLLLYGVSPVEPPGEPLIPTMRLMARVTLVRTLPAGHGISYGSDFKTTRETRVATVGIGYGDGYPRSLSGNGGEVFVKGRRLPVLGRVTMDQIMIDATGHDEVIAGDDVELFGPNIPVGELAKRAKTIPWAILTGITRRVVRIHR